MSESKKDTAVAAKSSKTIKNRKKPGRMAPPTKGETLVKGVVMGFIISNANQVSRSIASSLIRHPLALFATGFVTGYLTHKYRKEIIVLGSQTAEESKNFVLRQKENLLDFVAECEQSTKDNH
jgi:hypothetical protein